MRFVKNTVNALLAASCAIRAGAATHPGPARTARWSTWSSAPLMRRSFRCRV